MNLFKHQIYLKIFCRVLVAALYSMVWMHYSFSLITINENLFYSNLFLCQTMLQSNLEHRSLVQYKQILVVYSQKYVTFAR